MWEYYFNFNYKYIVKGLNANKEMNVILRRILVVDHSAQNRRYGSVLQSLNMQLVVSTTVLYWQQTK